MIDAALLKSHLLSRVLATTLPWMMMPPLRPLFRWGVRRSLRARRQPHLGSPGDFGLAFSTERIATANGKTLHAWLIPALATAPRPAPALIVVHGWGGNSDLMLPLAPALHAAGMALLLLDTRCHGTSDDDTFASLPRFAEDTANAFDWLASRPEIDSRRIALLGHSVGAAAVLLAATWREQIAAVVSLAAFAQPAEMMRRWMAGQKLPKHVVVYILGYVEQTIGYRFDDIAPLATLPRLRCPVLLVHGEHDAVTPVSDAYLLQAVRSHDPARLLIGPGGHDSMEAFLTLVNEVVDFLTVALARVTVSGKQTFSDTPG